MAILSSVLSCLGKSWLHTQQRETDIRGFAYNNYLRKCYGNSIKVQVHCKVCLILHCMEIEKVEICEAKTWKTLSISEHQINCVFDQKQPLKQNNQSGKSQSPSSNALLLS